MSVDSQKLIRAVMERDVRTVKGLLAAGADANVRDSRGKTPLYLASGQDSEPRLGIVRELLTGGANPRAAAADGAIPLFAAIGSSNTAVMEMLLSFAPETINHAALRDCMTPLCLAAVVGARADVMEMLLSRGATNTIALEREGLDMATCPLYIAVSSKREDLVRLLLEKGMAAIGGLALIPSALFAAAHTSQPRIARMLISVEGEHKKEYWARYVHMGACLLNHACAFNALGVVSLLLHAGAKETVADSRGSSALDAVGSLVEHPGWRIDRMNVNCSRDPVKESAIRAMLKRAPAYRARSWVWPVPGEGGAPAVGSSAMTRVSSTNKADKQVKLRAPLRIYRSGGARFFVRLVLDR